MIICYAHGGSDNHGCEAIIRGTRVNTTAPIMVYSANMLSDKTYGLDEISTLKSDSYKRYHHPARWFFVKVKEKLTKKFTSFSLIDGSEKGVYLFVGGDNYCYPGLLPSILKANERIRAKGNKTVLWGTSIEPEVLNQPDILEDIRGYDMIFARESITYQALIEHGLKEKTYLYPDPAFAMIPKETSVPAELFSKPVIGMNISPLIMKYTEEGNQIKQGYLDMIQYILKNTDCNIALIPHVVKRNNNDLSVIQALADQVNDKRIFIIEDHKAEELKYIISRCEFFVGARTHSTIAAYSTCVPTLVIGYSVKAKGIAEDLFGTDEGYVVDVRSMKDSKDMIDAFTSLYEKKEEIRSHLVNMMPEYKDKAAQAGQLLQACVERWT